MGLGILRRRRANQANLISTMILTETLVTLDMIIIQTKKAQLIFMKTEANTIILILARKLKSYNKRDVIAS
jgi:hypothetical protein